MAFVDNIVKNQDVKNRLSTPATKPTNRHSGNFNLVLKFTE